MAVLTSDEDKSAIAVPDPLSVATLGPRTRPPRTLKQQGVTSWRLTM